MTLRIGTLGAARITPGALLAPARDNPEVEVVAVAARDTDRARGFADEHGIPRVHPSYEALLADPEVDAVYNPLPNGMHGTWTMAALRGRQARPVREAVHGERRRGGDRPRRRRGAPGWW